MADSISNSIADINTLIDDISTNFNVERLKTDISSFIAELKQDKIQIEQLNTEIAFAKSVAINPEEHADLARLNGLANSALISAKAQLEKYKSTLQFLQSVNAWT